MKSTGDELTIFDPATGQDKYFIDQHGEVEDLRRRQNSDTEEKDDPARDE